MRMAISGSASAASSRRARRRRNVREAAFTGEMIECDEGDLVWLKKEELLNKKMWEGDRIFLKALDERQDFFSLKLRYEGEKLVEWKFENGVG